MNRREWLKAGAAFTGAGSLMSLLDKTNEEEQPDGTVVAYIKFEGRKYGLGFELTDELEHNLKFSRFLNNAVDNTIRARVHRDPRFTAL